MKLLDLTLPTAAENLALDETLLEHAELQAEQGTQGDAAEHAEVLRLWELPSTAVILGRSSRYELEVNDPATRQDNIPSLRRSSGGSTVVAGHGCLMYSVILSYQLRPHLRMLDEAHRDVMQRLRIALLPWLPEIQMEGTCDLTWQGKKFSGNALRCKRNYLLYHGTILYDFQIPLISRYLLEPPRQPDYRQKRPHSEFLTNVPIDVTRLRQAIAKTWMAMEPLGGFPSDLFQKLLQTRYLNPEWHRVSSPCDIPTASPSPT